MKQFDISLTCSIQSRNVTYHHNAKKYFTLGEFFGIPIYICDTFRFVEKRDDFQQHSENFKSMTQNLAALTVTTYISPNNSPLNTKRFRNKTKRIATSDSKTLERTRQFYVILIRSMLFLKCWLLCEANSLQIYSSLVDLNTTLQLYSNENVKARTNVCIVNLSNFSLTKWKDWRNCCWAEKRRWKNVHLSCVISQSLYSGGLSKKKFKGWKRYCRFYLVTKWCFLIIIMR